MAYSQHEWTEGELITAEKLNNIETGVAASIVPVFDVTAEVDNTVGEPGVAATTTTSATGTKILFSFTNLKGETGDAAGFGDIYTNVTTLEPGEEATVKVTADGKDTAKDFTFKFGLPKGEKGDTGKAAGFGEPTVAVSMLEPDQEATASVTAEGEDTAKVFHFNIGVPKGQPAGYGEITADVETLEPDQEATVELATEGDATSKDFHFKFGLPKGVPAGFGEITAEAEILEPDQEATASVDATGDATAKNLAFKIGVPKGVPAGFGEVIATAETLEPDQEATASVDATGDATAKNFAFAFGIPKGDKGDTGEKGETGDSAGFGLVTAEIETLAIGETATVSVDATGEATAKDFHFKFALPQGIQGEAAGFGDPTATAETLETGQDATVTVTAEGDDKAKVFNFAFGLPRGEKGDTGEAAGFAEVTSTVSTLEPGSVATLNLQASGDNTAKNLHFAFGIPKGDKGDTGNTPLLQKGDSTLQVSYDNGESYSDLLQLADLKGDQGTAAGFGVATASAYTLEPGESAWVSVATTGSDTSKVFNFTLGIPKGATGEKGDTGEGFSIYKTYASVTEMEADASNVEEGKFVLIVSNVDDEDNAKLYVKGADAFTFLTDLSGAQGIQGEKGEKGEKGDQGQDGVTPQLGKSDTAITVTYDGGTTVYDLVPLADLKGDTGPQGEQGEQGEKGDTGSAGADGVTPLLQATGDALQVSYDNGSTYSDLVPLADLKGDTGPQGEAAPTIAACTINIAGTALTGKLTLSDGSSVDITGTYSAE